MRKKAKEITSQSVLIVDCFVINSNRRIEDVKRHQFPLIHLLEVSISHNCRTLKNLSFHALLRNLVLMLPTICVKNVQISSLRLNPL